MWRVKGLVKEVIVSSSMLIDAHKDAAAAEAAHTAAVVAWRKERGSLFAKLWAIPSVRRHQTGDHEMRAIFPPEALEQVAGVIRARRQRPAASAAHLQRVV